jgi:hypothetical protein
VFICTYCSLLFFCSAKRKVTKEKAVLGQLLRGPKKALRCYRIALLGCMALVFSPGIAAMGPYQSYRLCLAIILHLVVSREKKTQVMGWAV